ncbi:alpha/beta hydrolase family esterase [Actinocorallia herbida]|nr:prolyl oligopeptidase family serine peptidase [Actinocorallia herbida]
MAVVAVALLPLPAAQAAPPLSDHLTITAAGTPAYRLEGDLTGGISVTDRVFDYETDKVQGTATLPGASGGTATVDLKISRNGIFGLSGTFALNDPQAQVQITANVSGNVTSPVDGTITWQANGTVRRGTRSTTQKVGFTLLDRRPDPGDHAIRITHAGQERSAVLRLPDDYDGTPRPVLFHFPGLLEAPSIAEFYGRMADYAQTRGFIMVTPEHYGQGWQGVPAGSTSPDVDDPGFVAALQDILVQRFNADPDRLYASGMSNGGFFTSKMACENQRFAAYAPVSGQLSDQAARDACHPGRPVPIALIHGDGDFVVPYAQAPESADFWARNNGCAATGTDTDLPDLDPGDNTTVTRRDYRDCPASAPVILYTIEGGGHNWPGGTPFLGPFLGGTTYDIDANAVIWDFVSRFHL